MTAKEAARAESAAKLREYEIAQAFEAEGEAR